jgi:peptidase M28-like protein
MHSATPRRAVGTAVGLLVLCALIVRRVDEPPDSVPASAPPTEFSAERAFAHVREIAQRPHPTGSADNARVRDYIMGRLRAFGLEPQVQEATGVGTRYPVAGQVRNILARVPGRTPGGLAVVLMAHYDGVAGGPAAGDDAAGAAAVLETVRALRAGPPLARDVMVLITDGEEAGLLGAAAFVREHPWARDVGVTLNFEARGTSGRSFMFETGAGNLDVARQLRHAGDVSATSLSVTVYRTLPNDTDLSEMAVLGKPALNFAFADGVERYHTAHDDVFYLDQGSLQHHGSQMLTLARAFGDGPLPRPVTGDAVFFDLPFVGLIVYPESWVLPIAIVGLLLVGAAVVQLARDRTRWIRDVTLGAAGTIVSTCAAAGVALGVGNLIVRTHDAMGWGGAPMFRGVYTAVLALITLTIALGGWALVRRWATLPGAHVGALVVWAILTLIISLELPGVSFLFAWPLIAGLLATRRMSPAPAETASRGRPAWTVGSDALLWIATAVAAAIMVSTVYALSSILLGAVGPGAIIAGALVSLLAWLLAPQMEALGGRRWAAAGAALVVALFVTAIGMATVRSSPAHPSPLIIAYALDADSTGAWLTVRGPSARALTAGRQLVTAPAWLGRLTGRGPSVAYMSASAIPTPPPTASVLSDSTSGSERNLVINVVAPAATETIDMRALGASVHRASIDGVPIDTSRYRRGGSNGWALQYSAPPATGIRLALTVPAGSRLSLDLLTRTPGVPPLETLHLPPLAPRLPDVVTVQTGDITLVHRTVTF